MKVTFEEYYNYFCDINNWTEETKSHCIIGAPATEEQIKENEKAFAEMNKKFEGRLIDKPKGKLSIGFRKIYQTSDGETKC